jgi:uncharacterized protein DUF5130
VAAGEPFTAAQRHEIDRAIRDAETLCRYEFSVFVGRSEGETRPFAERLHATLVAPERSVLVLVDPAAKLLEIVTGTEARRVVGGIVQGVQQLAEHARRPQVRHGS